MACRGCKDAHHARPPSDHDDTHVIILECAPRGGTHYFKHEAVAIDEMMRAPCIEFRCLSCGVLGSFCRPSAR